MLKSTPLIQELPYSEDSAAVFSPWLENHWAVFLDSGFPYSRQGRYDILAAAPYKMLITRGDTTEIHTSDDQILSPEDPFKLVRQALGPLVSRVENLPFCGGAIGYFAYDLARRLESIPVISEDIENIPEMIIGIYDWSVIVDHQQRRSWLIAQGRDPNTFKIWDQLIQSFKLSPKNDSARSNFRVSGKVRSNMSKDDYAHAFKRIMDYLREGDCYQVNLAQRFSAECEGSLWAAYQTLRRVNVAPFCSYLNFPDVQILSSSPERFLKVHDGIVEAQPIKGTRPRKSDAKLDQQQIQSLLASVKDRAENLMIVDLLRNDIGRTCQVGSIKVPKLFDVESFATVHHLVSTVRGKLSEGRHALDLLRACFPGGSITGAPKLRAMEIIEELEPHRRGVYCGSIAYIGFDGNMDSNITIRTLIHSDSTIRFWAGGGIVADSIQEDEYQETFDKAEAILALLEQAGVDKDLDNVGD